MYGYSYNASYMEDKHMVDCSLLCGIWFYRDFVPIICPIKIHTRWLPSAGLCFSPNDNYGDLALHTQEKIHV